MATKAQRRAAQKLAHVRSKKPRHITENTLITALEAQTMCINMINHFATAPAFRELVLQALTTPAPEAPAAPPQVPHVETVEQLEQTPIVEVVPIPADVEEPAVMGAGGGLPPMPTLEDHQRAMMITDSLKPATPIIVLP